VEASCSASPASPSRQAGTRCDIITVEGGGHGMGTWKDADQQHYKADMIAWLKRTLDLE